MGFLSELLHKLLHKEKEIEMPVYANNELNIDLSSAGINVNGKMITLPAKMSDFAFLGKARKKETELGVNYAWDEAGLYCYTRERGKVICFAVYMRKGHLDIDIFPKAVYSGVVTINGRNWEEEIVKGNQTEVFHCMELGKYLVTSEFCDMMNPSEHSNLEMSLK